MQLFEKWWESSSYYDQIEVVISFSHSYYSNYSLEPREFCGRALPQG